MCHNFQLAACLSLLSHLSGISNRTGRAKGLKGNLVMWWQSNGFLQPLTQKPIRSIVHQNVKKGTD
jgi:hypothetical protein